MFGTHLLISQLEMQGTEGRFHKLGCGNANDLAGRRALLDQLYNLIVAHAHHLPPVTVLNVGEQPHPGTVNGIAECQHPARHG